jgi:serine/threonine protein kinase
MSKPKFLGKGAYGEVVQINNTAVKKFERFGHFIQEYTALKYLENCPQIVKCVNANYAKREIAMELYDCNLHHWLQKTHSLDDRLTIGKEILLGLIYLHDLSLIHGDIKPGNILVRKSPLKAVIGDCGFVSFQKYVKTEYTTLAYREIETKRSSAHDMYSFGITFFNLLTGQFPRIEINTDQRKDPVQRKAALERYLNVVDCNIKRYLTNKTHEDILRNLIWSPKDQRLSAREVLFKLFNEETERTYPIPSPKLSRNLLDLDIRQWFKDMNNHHHFQRCNRGYIALIIYLHENNIEKSNYLLYMIATITILSTLFNTSEFNETHLANLSKNRYTIEQYYEAIDNCLSNRHFLTIILRDPEVLNSSRSETSESPTLLIEEAESPSKS